MFLTDEAGCGLQSRELEQNIYIGNLLFWFTLSVGNDFAYHWSCLGIIDDFSDHRPPSIHGFDTGCGVFTLLANGIVQNSNDLVNRVASPVIKKNANTGKAIFAIFRCWWRWGWWCLSHLLITIKNFKKSMTARLIKSGTKSRPKIKSG